MPDQAGDAALAVSAGAALWDDWEVPPSASTPPRVPAAPELHLDGFDGPVDLLLDLVERERIDLTRLSIRALIDQFAEALDRYGPHVSLERRADWLVLAARLVALRSQLLFASDPAIATAAEQEAERERLQDRQFVRAAAAWLEARPQFGQDVFARPARDRDPRVASYMKLMEACLTPLEREEEAASEHAKAEAVYRPAVAVLHRIPEVLARLRAALAELSEPVPFRVFLPHLAQDGPDRDLRARSAVTSTLLAALELARDGAASLTQELAFGTITVALRKTEPWLG